MSRQTHTTQQYGNLASVRHTPRAMHDLGDRMVVTNSRTNLQLSEQMPPGERSTFDALARRANETEFGVSVAQWIAQTYPGMIGAVERVSTVPELREALSGALPELRGQLAEAEKVLAAASSASATQSGPPGATGSVAPKRSD